MTAYRFIDAEKAVHTVRRLCQALAVSRSAYYEWRARGEDEPADLALRVHVRAVHKANFGTYGRLRVTKALRTEEGLTVNHKRVARIMREEGLAGVPRRRFRVSTTDSKHSRPVAPNLLQRDFTAPEPNKIWVSDVTYLRTSSGWAYLATVIDLFSRKVVGWAVAEHMRTELCLEALRRAMVLRRPAPGLILHSDRGAQYASHAYGESCRAAGIVQSMSRAGDCWDNAVAESFFGTLKQELVRGRVWSSVPAARRDVGDYIHEFYNSRRLHGANGLRSPAAIEAEFNEAFRRHAA